jgi:hypothetical protein
MSLAEYFEFAFFFLFLGIWIAMSYLGTFKTERILSTSWGKSIWRNTPQRGVRFASAIFLLVGVLFLVFAIEQLSTGTFKWRGNPKTYSFSDFFK